MALRNCQRDVRWRVLRLCLCAPRRGAGSIGLGKETADVDSDGEPHGLSSGLEVSGDPDISEKGDHNKREYHAAETGRDL